MGYVQFNKTTIQLPLPSATMTKAEYKEAYGIDLDDLDFAKVTLLIDGNEKYSVDEIRIVSGDVLIFGGGKILTIGDDDNISVTGGAYSVEHAKPLFWHGLYIGDGSLNNNLQGHVLNNSPESIDSVAKLDAWFKSISGDVVLAVNGAFTKSGVTYTAFAIQKKADNTYLIFYITDSGVATHSISTLSSLYSTVNDSSNEIL
jgi:hypothetical protein